MADGKHRADMRSLVRGVFNTKAKGPMLLLNLLRQHWPDVVGPELSARTWPLRLERGTLWIGAPDASWVYELQFFKSELLASVQTFLEQGGVTDLRFRVGAVPDDAAAAAAQPAPEPAPTTSPHEAEPEAPATRFSHLARTQGTPRPSTPRTAPARNDSAPSETPERLAAAAQAIADPTLRAVFQRSLAKQRRSRRDPEERHTDGKSPPADTDRGEEH